MLKKALKIVARDNLRRVQKASEESIVDSSDRKTSWTSKEVIALVFCCLFLAIQIAVPIIKLTAPRPARFGWQMWSGRKKFPQFFLVKGDRKWPAKLSPYIAWSRGEMDFTNALPAHLCRVVPEIDAVEIRTRNNETQTFPCVSK